MPHLDSEVMDFAGSTCFASLDFVSAYWQLPLHPESYSKCGIFTPKTVLASKRVLPGLANATSYFQSTVEPLFAELRDHLKAWLDDFNLHAKTEIDLLSHLEIFFQDLPQAWLILISTQVRAVRRKSQVVWTNNILRGLST